MFGGRRCIVAGGAGLSSSWIVIISLGGFPPKYLTQSTGLFPLRLLPRSALSDFALPLAWLGGICGVAGSRCDGC